MHASIASDCGTSVVAASGSLSNRQSHTWKQVIVGCAALFGDSKNPLVYLQPASVSCLYLVTSRDLCTPVVCAQSNVSIACSCREIEMENSNSGYVEELSPGAPPKFSRYHSVRAKAASEPSPPPVSVLAPGEQSGDLKRAPSRYRRNRAATNTEAPPPLPPSLPQNPPNPTNRRQIFVRNHDAENTVPHTTEIVPEDGKRRAGDRSNIAGAPGQAQPARDKRREGRTHTTTSDPTRPPAVPRTSDAAREEARMILEGEFDRMQELKRRQAQQQVNAGSGAPDMRRRPTTSRDLAKDKKLPEKEVHQTSPKELRQPRAAVPRGEERPEQKSPPVRKMRQMIIRGGGDAPPQLQKREVAKDGHSRNVSKGPAAETLKGTPTPWNLVPVVPAGGTSEAVKTFDAPVSAVNAGDRRVEVRCNQATITLPVTPSTTVRELLNSASVVMSEKVDPRTAVLVEALSHLGLERPLRRYERIRDIMNSWDTDNQHHLVVMPETECSAPGLEVKDAPNVAPPTTQVHLHHSLSPGKWDKRWLTLRQDGQATVSKHENGKESTNICHLSDFDLYTPTAKQKKKLRTPKKICFAAKSQQKAAMFLEGQNFAHFFCSNQKETADKWYKALHSWRSWYLVNVLGEGEKKPPQPRKLSFDFGKRPSTAQSHDTVPYQLGSFKPLMDLSNTNFGSNQELRETEHVGRRSLDIHSGSPQRVPRHLGAPPSAFPKRLIVDAMEQNSREDEENQAFTGSGLLASSASRRTQGCHGTGRGIAAPKGKPMVDLSAESEFADGSLLRRMEALAELNGDAEPIIDREKRVEANVKVGEGA